MTTQVIADDSLLGEALLDEARGMSDCAYDEEGHMDVHEMDYQQDRIARMWESAEASADLAVVYAEEVLRFS